MESKLNQAAVSEYSASFSARVSQQAYQHKEELRGQEILSLTPLKQVNLLVVKEIFLRWKSEVEQLKSPYFDYESAEVKAALNDFMNVVSQHIAIDQQHLLPLLQQAVQDTIYLVLAPYDFYLRMLSASEKSAWTLKELEELLKYIRINRPLLEKLTVRCRQETSDLLSKEQVLNFFKQLAGQLDEAPEDTEPYIRQFNEIAWLDADTLSASSKKPAPDSHHLSRTPSSPASSGQQPEEKPKKEEGPRTLNDYLNKAERSTLADQHQKRKIERLSQHISVNQKFMFIRELFNNNAEAFSTAIRQLDEQHTYAEAINLIRRDYAQNYRWKMDSEEVLEFMELISKRF